jgi:hypothetical protein
MIGNLFWLDYNIVSKFDFLEDGVPDLLEIKAVLFFIVL